MKLVELYRFVESGLITTQTSGAVAVTYAAELYEPYPIKRSQVESKNELQRASVELTMNITNPLAARYLSQPVDAVVTLTIFQQLDAVSGVFWKGRLSGVKGMSGGKVSLTFESVFTSLRRPGLRKRYQRPCPYALYGRGCFVDPEDFRFDTTVTAMSGLLVTVASVDGAPDARYRGGMIMGPDNVKRYILDQTGLVLNLSRPYENLAAAFALSGPGVPVSIYRGCAHNMAACLEFDNLLNYGGFPWIPTKNPFGGSSIA